MVDAVSELGGIGGHRCCADGAAGQRGTSLLGDDSCLLFLGGPGVRFEKRGGAAQAAEGRALTLLGRCWAKGGRGTSAVAGRGGLLLLGGDGAFAAGL